MSTVEDAFVAYRTTRDPAALAAVYDGTSSRLLAVALHLSGSSSAAEDAVQDTFLFALQHPDRWDAGRPLIPWLLGILTNLLKQSAYRARRAPDPERLQMPDNPGPESELAAAELLSQIESAITDLPQPYRTVVLLRLRNGLTPADIAVALDRKPSTVRAQLTRGVEMLRKVLPTAVATLLIGSAATAQGLTSAREVVMQRADELHKGLQAQYTAATVKSWSLGALALSVLALVVWGAVGVFGGDPELPAGPAVQPTPVAAAEPETHVAPLRLPVDKEVRREAVALTGAVQVSVLRAGRGMPDAVVELEPLGNTPQALVHHTSSSRGSWRQIESLRPCPSSSIRKKTTSVRGTCAFDNLAAGHWICRSLGTAQVVRVIAGQVSTQQLAVESECQLVRGLVLDAQGNAVAGAAVWACREHLRRVRDVVAQTDASGRFTLAVAPFTTVGVSHGKYAPVAKTIGRIPTGPPRDVVLHLEQLGAAVAGVVRGPDGNPVANAEVQVGHVCDTRVTPVAETEAVVARPVRVRTNSAGYFHAEALVDGETTVTVLAAGLGVASKVVTLRVGEQAKADLSLQTASTVRGVVRDSIGAPVAGATVRIGRKGSLYYRVTTTDSLGAYELRDVSPGRPLIEVTDYRDGFVCDVLHCEPGEEQIFDATLSVGDLRLVGRVINSEGHPTANAWIMHRHRQGQTMHRLDADGRFAIDVSERHAAIPSSICVFEHVGNTRPKSTAEPLAIVSGLRAGSDNLEIRIGQHPRSSWLRGSVPLDGGEPIFDKLELTRLGHRWSRRSVSVASDGTFEVGPLTSGRFELRVEGSRRMYGPFDLVPGKHHDVGELPAPSRRASAPLVQYRRQLAVLFPPGVSTMQGVQLEVRDEAGQLLILKSRLASVTELTEMYVILPEGRFAFRLTTESGLVAEQQVVIDAAVPCRRALLVQLRGP